MTAFRNGVGALLDRGGYEDDPAEDTLVFIPCSFECADVVVGIVWSPSNNTFDDCVPKRDGALLDIGG